MELLCGQMVANIKARIRKVKKTVKGNIHGKMAVTMKETGSIIKLLDTVYMYGLMVEHTKVIG